MFFEIYKRGQGYYTRFLTAVGLGIVSGLGCWRLYEKLGGLDISATAKIWVQAFIPVGLLGVLAWVIFWLVNNPKAADFMISAEGEIKKVSWSSRKEVAASTFVVISVVIALSLLLMFTDLFFQFFFRAINLLQ